MTYADELLDTAAEYVNEFGEAAVYIPRSGSFSRDIKAVVERGLPDVIPEGRALAFKATVIVVNRAADGIASTEIDTGGDMIQFPLRLGLTPSARPIKRIFSQDNGMLYLGVV